MCLWKKNKISFASNIIKWRCQEKVLDTHKRLLYDFYGELLTEHQQNVYEDVVLNDYSLSEVAQDQGISRQGVHDLVKRSTRILEEYEEKLHLVEKFVAVREKVHEIHGLTQHYEEKDLNQVMNRIETLSHSILEEL